MSHSSSPSPRLLCPFFLHLYFFATVEQVLGQAGPYRAFFADVCHELQSCKSRTDPYPLRLLVPTPNQLHCIGEGRDLFMPNPFVEDGCTLPRELELFEFLGRLLGIAFRTKILLSLDIAFLFWKQLCFGYGTGFELAPRSSPYVSGVHSVFPDRADFMQVDQSFVLNVLDPLESYSVSFLY